MGSFPKSHSLRQLSVQGGLFTELKEEISLLEGDYAVSRYPDAYGKAPRSIYSSKMFKHRLAAAAKIVEAVKKWMKS